MKYEKPREIIMGGNTLWDRPLTIAAIGSLIVLFGQLFATIIPIMLGPDLSDYMLYCDPVYKDVDAHIVVPSNYSASSINISDHIVDTQVEVVAVNLHPLQRYKHQIYLKCTPYPGYPATFDKNIINVGESTKVTVPIKFPQFPIDPRFRDVSSVIIQGAGADGKMRNCTLYLKVRSLEVCASNRANDTGLFAYREFRKTTLLN